MIIHHDLAAIKTMNSLSSNSKNQGRSMKRLASGEKFSSAGDGAASTYSISEKMRVQLRALEAANKNISDGKDFSNTAMGALENILDILKGIKEKCLESANGIYTAQDRKIMDADVQHALDEMTEIAVTTQQNGVLPLNAQTGAYNGTMVINNRYPYTAGGQFRPVVDVGGTQIRISDEGSDGSSYYNSMKLYINGVAVGPASVAGDITSMPGWTAVRQESDSVWSRQLHYVDAANGINICLTQKTTLKSNYSDLGIKYGESYATTFELENFGAPAKVDFVYMVDTDLYEADKGASMTETYHDEMGNAIVQETLYVKEMAGLPKYFEGWTAAVIEKGVCAGINVAQGDNAPDAVVLAEWSGWDLDEIKQGIDMGGAVGGSIVNEDLAYQMAWVDKTVSDKITFDTGSYGFHTLDKKSPTAWIQSGTKSNDGFQITLCSATAESMGLGDVNVLTKENALAAIDAVDVAYERLARMSTSFGTAYQRCENAGSVNTIYHENLSSAESVIRDVNMAKEFVNFTKNNILSQASQTMLAQAGQNSQTVLKLLYI